MDLKSGFAGNPYACRSWLYVGMPWSRPRSMSIAPRSTTPLKHFGSDGSDRHASLPETGTWNSTLRRWLSICSSLLYCGSPPIPFSIGPSFSMSSRVGLKNIRFSDTPSVTSPLATATSTPAAFSASSSACV